MENVAQKNEKSISGAIKVNEKEVMEHLDGLVRKFVEDTLNTFERRSGCNLQRCSVSAKSGSTGYPGRNI